LSWSVVAGLGCYTLHDVRDDDDDDDACLCMYMQVRDDRNDKKSWNPCSQTCLPASVPTSLDSRISGNLRVILGMYCGRRSSLDTTGSKYWDMDHMEEGTMGRSG
jgi:hypothetical protein